MDPHEIFLRSETLISALLQTRHQPDEPRLCLPLDNTCRSSAVIYTFVEQIRRHGAAPSAYCEWVFEKLMHNPAPEEIEALLPADWIKARPTACQAIESRVAWMP